MSFRCIPRSTLVLLVVAFSTVMSVAYSIGYVSHALRWFPSNHIFAAKTILLGTENEDADDDERSLISTVFLVLSVDRLKVPVQRAGSGGGITSVRNELLLLTHDGAILSIDESQALRTNISPPNNGYLEYAAASESERWASLEHRLDYIRYNDLLYFEEDARSFLVASYTEWQDKSECYNTAVAVLDLPPSFVSIRDVTAEPADWRVAYRTQPCLPPKDEWRAIEGHMAGGRISYKGSQKIVLGSGDYHFDGMYGPGPYAQSRDNDYGKVLEIGLETSMARIISIGNRNTQGVLVDQEGNIWVVEHGMRGGDELNLIQEGANFGWPVVSLGTQYTNLPLGDAAEYGRHDNFARPFYAWLPSVATSGLTQIKDFHSAWDGDLLVSSLAATSLYRVRIREGRVIFAEPIPIGERIRYVHQHSDALIVLWTDNHELIFLSAVPDGFMQQLIDKTIQRVSSDSEYEQLISNAIIQCAECHSFQRGNSRSAPSLADTFGSRIASGDFRTYSTALTSLQENIWTERRLRDFLADPQEFAPGSTMPNPHISDETVLTGVVEFLKALKNPE